MMNEKYYVELDKLNKLLERKNKKTDFYNGIYDRYEYPVLTREMIPLTWRYDLNPETTVSMDSVFGIIQSFWTMYVRRRQMYMI